MAKLTAARICLFCISFLILSNIISGCKKKPRPGPDPRLEQQRREWQRKMAQMTAMYDKNIAKLVAQYDKQHRISLTQMCGYVCVSQWSQWSSCSKPCGTGTRSRTRRHQAPGQCGTLKGFTCPHKNTRQQESCNTGCPNGGTPTNTGCSCKPAWAGTCCKQQVRCPYVRRPVKANVDGSWPAFFGAVVTFTCDDGYDLQGPEKMQCAAGPSWEPPTPPTCSKITCDRPQGSSNLQTWNPQESYDYGDDVYYACPVGYVLKGPMSIKCVKDTGNRGKWNSAPPTCEASSCGDPGKPDHVVMNGTSFGYGDEVTFSCESGYQLLGHQTLKCMASGRWYGTVPQCIEIKCEPPPSPKFGSIHLGTGTGFNSIIVFSCDEGYVLDGSSAATCTDAGNWNTTAPTCKAATCTEPTVPDHGSKDGSMYFFPHMVKFSCYSGYTLNGPQEISCKADGTWSGTFPTCQPCPKGFYMDKVEQAGKCQSCPQSTSTLTEGSTNRRHCICNRGYHGPAGGPCTEIKCQELFAPDNGQISNCTNTFGGKCYMYCNDGYVIDKGSAVRTCMNRGEWDGTAPGCSACPKDYYKLTSRSCLQCPSNSYTQGEASVKTDCKCEAGYKGPDGGPCEDINECEENNGAGPCEDSCVNELGGFECRCIRPGYIINENGLNCKVERECRNLTSDDAPGNGGLVCHWYYEENSQQCSVMCNDGFMFPSRINNYETCGPTTGYTWTFKRKDPESRIPSCIEEYFPGMRIEADANFFTTNCSDISEDEKKQVFQNFKQRLDENQVCVLRRSKVCNVEDMAIICGKRVRRHVPGEGIQEGNEFDFEFNTRAIKKWDDPRKDCDKICPFLRIRPRDCAPALCNSAYKRFLRIALLYAKRQLQNIFSNRRTKQRLAFTAAGRTFSPGSRIRQGDVLVECPIGMVADDSKEFCVPCEPGYFYNTTGLCQICPAGTFQPFKNQTSCLDCFPGTTAKEPGSLLCDICPEGFFGTQCAQACTCVNGTCDPIKGTCTCKPGWEGPNCDQDVDGCREVRCYPGVACIDIPAPATGFNCGPCPSSLVGDGLTCERNEL